MAYLVKSELKSVIRLYELDAITAEDDGIVEEAIAKAIEKAANILTPNDKLEWYDGRILYDAPAIFAAEGSARNLLVLGYVKSITLYFICELYNIGADYKDVQDRYDRAEGDLKDLASGVTNSSTLPRLTTAPPEEKESFYMGSRRKFNHE
ncbi:hypothetical protein J3L18_23175 [Mucilaginibacter gossypii]|uniref:hypothetical protein n=1 Tax=Mucilaginibacter gossypii TaxID=551996 RepID=UPI000DCB03A3|nr:MULTISPECIES: hypothetical protein [Mucilaginibacter]QTE36018.1 hypothetical protein J3L18_23175 [Mucilaginibacter gossypii]RAV56691.1 hypothetical protein DIU36_14920 [Mucilaginibacter rubeus]